MKNVYVAVGLTFLLNLQGSRSMNNLAESSSAIKESISSEEVGICDTDECQETAYMLYNYVVLDGNPCEDFYEFACGYFSLVDKGEGSSMMRRFCELDTYILYYLDSDHDYNIQAFGKIQRIFALCMDEDAIDVFGFNVIQLQLNYVGLPTTPPFHQMIIKTNHFDQILAKMYRDAAIQFVFAVKVSIDRKDYTKNCLIVGLYFLSTTVLNNAFKFQEYYRVYMMDVINHLYNLENMEISHEFLDLVSDRVNEVIQFFLSLYEVKKEYENAVEICELMKLRSLQKKTDKILRNSNIKFNWLAYLSTIFKNNIIEDYVHSEPILVCSMKYIENIFKIISGIHEEVLEASLWWVTVDDVISIADGKLRSLRKIFLGNTGNVLNGRMSTCLNFVKDQFGHALTHLLLQEIDSERDIAEIVEMTENVRKSFEETIKNAQWLDESTREEALCKLNKIKTVISHEKWVENRDEIENKYADVKLKHTWYMTLRTEKVRIIKNKLKLLFTTNYSNEKHFLLSPLNTYAYYDRFYNTVVIPFTYLGLPFIHHGLRYMDYGALAFIIGHEFSHAFTRGGAVIDSSGDYKNWWNTNALQEFNNRAECFVDSYSKFIFRNKVMQNDGYLTLDENIADNVGMKLAFDAYDLYAAKFGPEKKLIGFQNMFNSEQLLTIAMATTWCWNAPDNYTDEPMQIQEGVHSPPPLRINGIFMNSNRMANIWKCPRGSPMNPSEKCYIW